MYLLIYGVPVGVGCYHVVLRCVVGGVCLPCLDLPLNLHLKLYKTLINH